MRTSRSRRVPGVNHLSNHFINRNTSYFDNNINDYSAYVGDQARKLNGALFYADQQDYIFKDKPRWVKAKRSPGFTRR